MVEGAFVVVESDSVVTDVGSSVVDSVVVTLVGSSDVESLSRIISVLLEWSLKVRYRWQRFKEQKNCLKK